MDELINLLKAISDKSRILILNTLFEKPRYVEEISNLLELAPSTVTFHLKKLEKANVISSKKEQYYTIYSINEKILNKKIIDVIKIENPNNQIQKERELEYKNKVIKSFIKYNKLIRIPAQRKKRKIILELLAKDFEMKKEYTEYEVNIILVKYHDDVASLRRHMIEENIMERKNNIYWLKKTSE